MPSTLSENNSLHFLHTIAYAIDRARSTNVFLDENLPPSEILSLSNNFIKTLQVIDGSLSVMKMTQEQMEDEYNQNLTRYYALRNTYVDRINARKATDNQMNTTSEIYEKDKLFKEIIFKDEETLPRIFEIVKPEEYSVLSIIEKMKKDEPNRLKNLKYLNNLLFDKMEETIELCRNGIINFRRLLSSPRFIQEMSTDVSNSQCMSYVNVLQSSMNFIIKKMDDLRRLTTEIFQIYLAMETNYYFYEKATNSLTSITLESVFNKESYYEL